MTDCNIPQSGHKHRTINTTGTSGISASERARSNCVKLSISQPGNDQETNDTGSSNDQLPHATEPALPRKRSDDARAEPRVSDVRLVVLQRFFEPIIVTLFVHAGFRSFHGRR